MIIFTTHTLYILIYNLILRELNSKSKVNPVKYSPQVKSNIFETDAIVIILARD